MNKNIDVLILCGGEGKRLRKVSGKAPKPMVLIGNKPFLDIVINYFKSFGFKKFILSIGYKSDYIKKYYRLNKPEGIKMLFSKENQPLGTGGAVKKVKRLIQSKSFLVLNGDSFARVDIEKFVKFYRKKKAKALILLRTSRNGKDVGRVTINKNSELTNFSEKTIDNSSALMNSGIYLFDTEIFSYMPRKKVFSLEYDFFPQMIGKRVYGYKETGFFVDIGTPERYFAARKYLLKNSKRKDNK